MAAVAGNEMEHKVDAVALVVGLAPQRASLPSRPVPTMAFRGFEDIWVPYAGGKAGAAWIEHAEVQARNRAILNGADPIPEITSVPGADGIKLHYKGTSPVILYRLYSHGHNWPGKPAQSYETALQLWKSTPHGDRMAEFFDVSVEDLAKDNSRVSPLDATVLMLDFFDNFVN
jgi:poly(3-hydroxybutyrate) depolymerase